MESGGTVLSTNWTDVGKRTVDVNPPDDMEWKQYWRNLAWSFITTSQPWPSLHHVHIWPDLIAWSQAGTNSCNKHLFITHNYAPVSRMKVHLFLRTTSCYFRHHLHLQRVAVSAILSFTLFSGRLSLVRYQSCISIRLVIFTMYFRGCFFNIIKTHCK